MYICIYSYIHTHIDIAYYLSPTPEYKCLKAETVLPATALFHDLENKYPHNNDHGGLRIINVTIIGITTNEMSGFADLG